VHLGENRQWLSTVSKGTNCHSIMPWIIENVLKMEGAELTVIERGSDSVVVRLLERERVRDFNLVARISGKNSGGEEDGKRWKGKRGARSRKNRVSDPNPQRELNWAGGRRKSKGIKRISGS